MHWLESGACIASPSFEAGEMHSNHFSTSLSDANQFTEIEDSSRIKHINVYENN
jgi:hypothetical protein